MPWQSKLQNKTSHCLSENPTTQAQVSNTSLTEPHVPFTVLGLGLKMPVVT